jgi:hypothetical protein
MSAVVCSVRIGLAFLCATVLLGAPKQLTVERIALHQFEDGPVLPPDHIFLPGETVYFSCRVTGYQIEKKEEDQNVKISWEMRVVDPAGVLVEKPRAGSIAENISPQDKNWMPKFLSTFVVPPYAVGGVYRISVKVKDELAQTEVGSALELRVRGHEVEPSDTLVVRNFRFLRNEDDQAGLAFAAYRPGDMLWARFDITGYKFGENNRFSVEYGLAVLDAAGEQKFSQPDAAADSNESFYPQRYVPGALSLSLDKNVSKGSYTLVLTVRDKMGNQSWESRHKFQVQ